MQMTQQQHGEPERVYTMAGDGPETTRLRIAGFIREELARTQVWSPEMKTLMQNFIDMPEILPDREQMEFHGDGRVL